MDDRHLGSGRPVAPLGVLQPSRFKQFSPQFTCFGHGFAMPEIQESVRWIRGRRIGKARCSILNAQQVSKRKYAAGFEIFNFRMDLVKNLRSDLITPADGKHEFVTLVGSEAGRGRSALVNQVEVRMNGPMNIDLLG